MSTATPGKGVAAGQLAIDAIIFLRASCSMNRPVPLLVIAPDELSRMGLLRILSGSRYKRIAAYSAWDEAVAAGKSIPALVILILSGTTTDPIAVAAQVGPMVAQSKVVVLADHLDAKLVRAAICAGAAAYLPRSVSTDALMQTLELVLEGEVLFPASVAREALLCKQTGSITTNTSSPERTIADDRVSRLSSREVEILKRLVHGASNKQISRELNISDTTVKVHVKAVLRKLGLRNRTQAAVWGADNLSNELLVLLVKDTDHD
ncbi:MAG: LuxR C-terminal-related transcriptional regulator [Variibacter sp.]